MHESRSRRSSGFLAAGSDKRVTWLLDTEIRGYDRWIPSHAMRGALTDRAPEVEYDDLVTYRHHEAHVVLDDQ
jgi:hypothetical protein